MNTPLSNFTPHPRAPHLHPSGQNFLNTTFTHRQIKQPAITCHWAFQKNVSLRLRGKINRKLLCVYLTLYTGLITVVMLQYRSCVDLQFKKNEEIFTIILIVFWSDDRKGGNKQSEVRMMRGSGKYSH